IWGRPLGAETDALHEIVSHLPEHKQSSIKWMGEYRNQDIVSDVFNHCDAIVVPSIWVENSPLVIHEALQAHVPVITADIGGMAEYIRHEVNGLLFVHRDVRALAEQMQRFVANPTFARQISEYGYLESQDRMIPNIIQHVQTLEAYYAHVHSVKRGN